MKHPYAANIGAEAKEIIAANLSHNHDLMGEGAILTGPDGNLLGISKYLDGVDQSRISGCLEYCVRDGSLDVRYIKNRPHKEHTCGPFREYESEKAREDGRKILMASFLTLPEFINVNSMWTDTWVIPARPHLLEDPKSCFYLWTPKSPEEHAEAVRHFMKKPVVRLRDHKHAQRERAEYLYHL